MVVPADAVTLVAGFEGFRSRPYKDTGGVWTIGYGSTYLIDGKTRVAQSTAPVTQAQAIALLSKGLEAAYSDVKALVTVPLTGNQTAALLSFIYNEGGGNFHGSTLLRKLNERDYAGASAQFPRWNLVAGRVSPGLVTRRKAERALFDKA